MNGAAVDARSNGLLKMSELADRSGVSSGTIKHYLREGLLPEPVLDLDEALDSPLVREREMVVELDQPGAQKPVRQLGPPVKLSRTPGGPQGPGPALGEHTDEVLAALGYGDDDIASLKESGAAAGPASGTRGSFLA